jgi:hypothetical protein
MKPMALTEVHACTKENVSNMATARYMFESMDEFKFLDNPDQCAVVEIVSHFDAKEVRRYYFTVRKSSNGLFFYSSTTQQNV